MTKRLFDYDPATGAFETFEYDHSSGGWGITRTSGDLQPLVDSIKELHNHHYNRHRVLGYHVARIPVELVHKWLVEKGVNAMDPRHWPEVRKLLNSNEYQDIRPDRRML